MAFLVKQGIFWGKIFTCPPNVE